MWLTSVSPLPVRFPYGLLRYVLRVSKLNYLAEETQRAMSADWQKRQQGQRLARATVDARAQQNRRVVEEKDRESDAPEQRAQPDAPFAPVG